MSGKYQIYFTTQYFFTEKEDIVSFNYLNANEVITQ